MDKNKTLILFSLLFTFISHASAGTVTPNLLLESPVAGDTDYPNQITNTFNTLDRAICDKRTGCTVLGDIIIPASSGSFVGDGSFLTGIPSQVQFVKEDLLSFVDGATDIFTLSTTPFVNSLKLVMDGLTQEEGTDYILILAQVVMTTAPTSDTSSFIAYYSTGAASSGGTGGGGGLNVDPPLLGIGTAGDHLRLDGSSVTLQGNTFNNPNQLVRLDGTSRLPAVDGSLLTGVISGATAVNTQAPITGNGLVSNPIGVDSSSVTLLGPSPDHDLLSNVTANQHHTPTVDTNAGTICSGDTTYLDGDGNCDVITLFLPSVVSSSDTSDSTPINSLTYVAVTTTAITMIGGRFVAGDGIVTITNNAAGGTKTYDIQVFRDGITSVTGVFQVTVANGGVGSVPVSWHEASSLSGFHEYSIHILSSSVNSPQTVEHRILSVTEHN